MASKIEVQDGSVVALGKIGDLKSPNGNNLTFSQVGSTNTYTASETVGSQTVSYSIDFGDRSGIMSRKVA